jgi:fatty acid desaturase
MHVCSLDILRLFFVWTVVLVGAFLQVEVKTVLHEYGHQPKQVLEMWEPTRIGDA